MNGSFHRDLQQVIHHSGGDIDTGSIDTVSKLHRVIDFIDQQSVFGFKQVNCQKPTSYSLCCLVA